MNDELNLSERLVRLETKIDSLIQLVEKVDKLQEKQMDNKHRTGEAIKEAQRAHERLDKKDKDENKFKWIIYAALILSFFSLITTNGG